MTLDSLVTGSRVEPMVGQSVQPIPHHTEVCDEHCEESSCWQARRATARGFTLATKTAIGASAPGGKSNTAATAAASDTDASEVDRDGDTSECPGI